VAHTALDTKFGVAHIISVARAHPSTLQLPASCTCAFHRSMVKFTFTLVIFIFSQPKAAFGGTRC
jgi:hypothetical protein